MKVLYLEVSIRLEDTLHGGQYLAGRHCTWRSRPGWKVLYLEVGCSTWYSRSVPAWEVLYLEVSTRLEGAVPVG